MPNNRTPVHCVQLQEEFDWLLDIYRAQAPGKVLEIGSHVGGTLYHWMKNAPEECDIYVVSLGASAHLSVWRDWAATCRVSLDVIDADSTAPETVDWMRDCQPYDFAFIDGSHWYEYVSRDWANVRTMMAPGGIVAFHDITEHGGMPNERVDVPRLWHEIKARGYRTDEKVALPGVYCGIGVVYL